jgi:cytochrome c oxidase cbb3-type subunit 1
MWVFGRLGTTMLAQGALAVFGSLLWHLGVAVGVGGILNGDASGFPGFEFPQYAGSMLFVGYVLIGVSAVMTFHRRARRELFVAQWFLFAALFWFPWVFSTAYLLLLTFPVRGVAQSAIAWWYSSHLHLMWFGLVGLGTVFYFVPKLSGRELQSRNLALFAFWTFLLFGGWTAIPADAPLPAWMPALGVVASVLMVIPLLTMALISYRTLAGEFRPPGDPASRFLWFGLAFFLLAGAMLIVGAIPGLTRNLHLTWFGQANWWAQVYGFFCMALFGAGYYVLPRLFGSSLRWPALAGLHFWLAAAGVILLTFSLAVAGLLEDIKFANPNIPFMDIVKMTLHFLRVSTIGDLLLATGHLLFLVNVAGLAFGFYRERSRARLEVATADMYPEASR